MTRPIGFWLVPAKPDPFTELIAGLAAEYDAPAFEPHITLHVGQFTPDEDIEALLVRAASTLPPLDLIAGETSHSEILFKTLFVRFNDVRLQALHDELQRGLAQLSDYILAPHLSLLYKNVPETTREALARKYIFHGERITFDRIAAARPAAGESGWSNIRGWDAWLRQVLDQHAN